MRDITRKSVPIHLIVHHPKTEAGKCELAKQVAGIHADAVHQYLKKLNCSSQQKEQLLDTLIDDKVGEKTEKGTP